MDEAQYYCQTKKRLYISGVKLPAGYTPVNYLQSINASYNNPYLNIGSLANHQYFDFEFEWVGFNNSGLGAQYGVNGLAGCNSFGANDVKIWLTSANKLSFIVGSTSIGSANITTGVKYRVCLSPSQFLLDGQDYTSGTATTTSTVDCYIFAVKPGGYEGVNNWTSNIKLYKFTTSSIDLYPCKRDSDNAPGMYDIVNNNFYANQGSGSFTTG